MSTGTLFPSPWMYALDLNGNPLSGAKAYFYVAGTSTPATTYSDAGLTTANANPALADAAGRIGPIYLAPGSSYKFVLNDATDALVRSQDNISTVPAAPVDAAWVNDFRLSLTSSVPVTVADVTAAATVYCTPMLGNRIDLPNSSGDPIRYTSAEFSIAVPATTSQLYDVFAYSNAGIATLELVPWTNDTTRATAIVRTNGRWLKSGNLTRLYLGSVRTTTVSGQTEDSAAKRFLWNAYNRVRRQLKILAASNWAYTTATYRQAAASATNQVAVVVGVAEVSLDVHVLVSASNTNTGVAFAVSVGEDSTTTGAAETFNTQSGTAIANALTPASAMLRKMPAVGYHFYAWLEYSSATGTTTWYGAATAPVIQSGISGWIDG